MKPHFPPSSTAALRATALAVLIAGSAVAAESAPPGADIGAAAQVVQPSAGTPAAPAGADAQNGAKANGGVGNGANAGANAATGLPQPAGTDPAQPSAAPMTNAPAAQKPAANAASPASAAPGSAASLLQVIFGLVVVLGLLGAALWALKRFGGVRMAGGAPLKIIGGVAVGNREKVLVLEVGDQWLVVGVAPGRVSMLTSLPRGEQRDAESQRPAPDFGAWLKQTLEKRNVK